MRRLIAAALVALAMTPQGANALPMQSVPAWMAWASANPVLRPVRTSMDQMTAGTLRRSIVSLPGLVFSFEAEAGDGLLSEKYPNAIVVERLEVQNAGDNYDVRKHPSVPQRMVQAVYSAAIASDFASAQKVGDYGVFDSKYRVLIARGKRYGYQTSGYGVLVFPLLAVNAYVQQAKNCARGSCGD